MRDMGIDKCERENGGKGSNGGTNVEEERSSLLIYFFVSMGISCNVRRCLVIRGFCADSSASERTLNYKDRVFMAFSSSNGG